MTLCVIDPEVALMVSCVTCGVTGAAVIAAAGCEEQPVIAAAVTPSKRARSDPRTRAERKDLRLRPANVSSPTGPMKASVMPTGEWNRWTAAPAAER